MTSWTWTSTFNSLLVAWWNVHQIRFNYIWVGHELFIISHSCSVTCCHEIQFTFPFPPPSSPQLRFFHHWYSWLRRNLKCSKDLKELACNIWSYPSTFINQSNCIFPDNHHTDTHESCKRALFFKTSNQYKTLKTC